MRGPLSIAVLGAGTRGAIFGRILADHPHLARVAAVAEPRPAYRAAFAAAHGLPAEATFETWQDFIAGPKRCDAVIVATMDRDHVGPAIACLERGYDLLLEKPVAPTPEECWDVAAAQERTGRMVGVCHSLRYHRGFAHVQELVASGRLGEVRSVDLLEQVGAAHFAHSYIRGNWGNAGRATPLLLAKSCHDLDYLAWLVGRPCQRVSSFGSLSHFHAAHAPAGAPSRCVDGCPAEPSCMYSAIKQYVQGDREAWPASVIAPEHTQAAHLVAITTGPYGRCVYRADNDVVDHQVVALSFEGGATATFTVTAFTQGGGRRLRVHGTQAELAFDETTTTIRDLGSRDVERWDYAAEAGPHGGGDHRAIRTWLEALAAQDPTLLRTDIHTSIWTHMIGFAAERARLEGRVVDVAEIVANGATA